MAHTPPIAYGVGMGGSGAQDPFCGIWAVPIGPQGAFYRIWGVDKRQWGT